MRALGRWACVLVVGLAAASCGPRQATPSSEERPAEATRPADWAGQPAAGIDATAGDPAAAPTAADAAALVNGEPVALEEYRRIAMSTQSYYVEQGLDPNTAEGQEQLRAIRRAILDDLIDQKLIEQAAAELGITVSDEEVQESLQKTIATAGGEEAFLRSLADEDMGMEDALAMERANLLSQRLFEKVIPAVPTTAKFAHARHIQCETEEACRQAARRLQAGEAFDAVARQLSADALTRDQGGDLGWVGGGTLPSRLAEEAIFALGAGERSDVVATEYGYHIFEVLEWDPERSIDQEQRLSIREAEILRWLADRRSQAVIEILVEELRATPTPSETEAPAAAHPSPAP